MKPEELIELREVFLRLLSDGDIHAGDILGGRAMVMELFAIVLGEIPPLRMRPSRPAPPPPTWGEMARDPTRPQFNYQYHRAWDMARIREIFNQPNNLYQAMNRTGQNDGLVEREQREARQQQPQPGPDPAARPNFMGVERSVYERYRRLMEAEHRYRQEGARRDDDV
jgi:hypothetical protein